MVGHPWAKKFGTICCRILDPKARGSDGLEQVEHLLCKHANSFQALHFLLQFLLFPTNRAADRRLSPTSASIDGYRILTPGLLVANEEKSKIRHGATITWIFRRSLNWPAWPTEACRCCDVNCYEKQSLPPRISGGHKSAGNMLLIARPKQSVTATDSLVSQLGRGTRRRV